MPRRLGQHFLTDPSILDRLINLLDPQPHDVVIEIGPGRGTLTRRLAPRVASVIAIEKDRTLADNLSREGIRGVSVVHADALEVDWQELVGPSGGAFKISGNVPYYISTPLIHQALSYPKATRIVFLVQREVADRICAGPGNRAYGGLSVGVQSFASAERMFRVAAGSFSPPPRVESTAIRLTPREVPAVPFAQRDAFRRFVTGIFGQRRKRIVRVLRNVMGLDADSAEAVLARCGIDPDARPEMLAPESLAGLFLEMFR